MTSRDTFLARVREAQTQADPAAHPLPELPTFEQPYANERRAQFCAALEGMGGQWLDAMTLEEARAAIAARFPAAQSICSATAEIPGTRVLDEDTPPASLHDVDVAVVRARFGVAETGSLFLTEREYRVNALGYLAQHLVALLDPAQLEISIADAYRRADFASARYAVFVTGPSATADIEGVLIRGAQGVRSLTVIFLAAP
jgi:L-lactate dehydrogenase complex protein LldG